MVEEATELGAKRVLAHMGLDDDNAHGDLIELRQLLRAWRDAKSSAWRAVVNWIVRGVLALLLVGIAVRMGAMELLRSEACALPAMPPCSACATRAGT